MATIVTGASGIAGAHILGALRSAGLAAIPVSRLEQDGWVRADLTNEADVRGLPEFASVVHCAALTPRLGITDPKPYRAANIETTGLLAREAVRRGASTFVFLSTMGRTEQQDDAAGRHYIATKREAEQQLLEICQGRCSVWILRAASLYGEYDKGSMARLILMAGRGRSVGLGSMKQQKCVLYAGSLGDLVVAELVSPDPSRPTTETAHDVETHDFAAILAAVDQAIGRQTRHLPAPDSGLRAIHIALRALASVTHIRALRNLATVAGVALRDVPCEGPNALERRQGDYVGLQEGVRREVEWLRAHGRL
jgi:nucleoside-diphosphate-sugar epimerase